MPPFLPTASSPGFREPFRITPLMHSLLATNGDASPSAPQTYGVLTAGCAAARQTFTFTDNSGCGSTIVANLQLQDGATSLGKVTVPLTLGALAQVFAENFDGVTAPAL